MITRFPSLYWRKKQNCLSSYKKRGKERTLNAKTLTASSGFFFFHRSRDLISETIIRQRRSQWAYFTLNMFHGWFCILWGKATPPWISADLSCPMCGPKAHLLAEASLSLVKICQWENKIKIAINFHRDAITRDVVIASCSDVLPSEALY